MKLQGQGRFDARSERGFAMAALLVALSVMAVMWTVAIPVWKTAVQREREEELVWRGRQYARAVMLFQRKYANATPPNLDILLNERFLRKKYKDPMTKDGEFQLVYAADQQMRPGEIVGAPPTRPGASSPSGQPAPPPSQLDQQPRGTAGPRGGIRGVVSKSTDRGLRLFNGRSKYNEWLFTPETLGMRPPGAPGEVPGGVRGGAAGAVGPGGRPGVPRDPLNLDRFGRPGTSPQPGQPPTQRPFGLPQPRPPQ